ncbi:MAG: MBL fold metallo-hydrolase [bacterium]|nr:MBL fold metallo-hydrolase [bacterium]
MQLQFHGAAQTVTGSMHLLSFNDKKVLLDCGLYQGRRQEARERNSSFPFDPHRIDCLLLSHAHLDHCGNIPTLIKAGFAGKIYCTHATRDLAIAILFDSAHVQMEHARYLNAALSADAPEIKPLYDTDDVAACLDRFVGIDYDRKFHPVHGMTAVFHDAGHILGSSIIVCSVEADGDRKSVCFSGDLGRPGMPILRDPYQVKDVDYLILESTYGSRVHESIDKSKETLRLHIEEIYRTGGRMIVPAFAVGRTQELVYILHHLHKEGRIPHIPVFVDSPLAMNVTAIFSEHPECYDEETRRFIKSSHEKPFGFSTLTYVKSATESRALNGYRKPCIVIASSGMCEGGRILHHLRHGIGNPDNLVLITGFAAENTLARRLVDGERQVPVLGEIHAVRARISVMHELSAHADRNDLLGFVKGIGPSLRRAFLVHGDPEALQSLSAGIADAGTASVFTPVAGESFA